MISQEQSKTNRARSCFYLLFPSLQRRGPMVASYFCLFFLLAACAGSSKVPDWVNGPAAAAYPAGQYMIGVGQGDTRAVAEQRAYAAVSRIFKADISSQSRD